MSLQGKVAIVTGSGRGLGLAYAQELARQGAAVVINDVDEQAAADAVATIESEGGRATAVVAPVGPTETAQKLLAAAVETFGGVDILVTNAGVLRDKTLWKMTDDDFDTVIGVHLRGTFTCVREVATHLREEGADVYELRYVVEAGHPDLVVVALARSRSTALFALAAHLDRLAGTFRLHVTEAAEQ